MSIPTTFDPQIFLDASIDTPSERREPLPVQDYTGIIGEIKSSMWTSKDGAETGPKWEFFIEVEVPPNLQDSLHLPSTLKVRDSILLNLTSNGSIDNSPGKNGRLRMYREALDLNKPGDRFSARMMQGRVVLINIKHETYEGNIQEKVGKVARR